MTDFLLAASPATLAAAVAVVAFAVAALAMGIARRRRDEARAALEALCAMKWREFAHHVVGVLSQRGLRQDDLDRRPGDDGFDIRMTRGAASYLVQCKQVGQRLLGEQAVRSFAGMVRLQGAEGGILVTTGDVAAAARRAAAASGIELLSGYQLWRQLRPLLPVDVVREIEAAARARRGRKALLAAGVGVAAGAATFLLAGALGAGPSPAPEPAAEAATPAAPTPVVRPATEPGEQSGDTMPMQLPDPTLSEAELAARRADAERSLLELPQVADAAWSTRSTMVLRLRRGTDGAFPEEVVEAACQLLVRYEELRYTRMQVQLSEPRDEDEARVRWRQCR